MCCFGCALYLLANSSVSLQRVDDWLLTDSDKSVLACQLLLYIYCTLYFNINFIRIHGKENGRLEGHFSCSPALQRVRVPLTSNFSNLQIRRNDAASKGALEVGEWTAWYV